MKILLLSDPNSPHTIKWARSLAENGMDIYIFGLGDYKKGVYEDYKNISVSVLNETITRKEGSLVKIKYLKALPKVKKIIREFKPDILHAHYASSYGLIGALSGFHPYIVSVWGSDVFSFPNKSFIHKKVIEYVLNKADKVLSTSFVMARQTGKYTNKKIEVTPFGIDLDKFKPMKVTSLFSDGDIVIGTIKTLEEKYGIEYLIKAFKLLSDKYPNLPLKLLIVGGGSLEKKLKLMVKDLKIDEKTVFTGRIPCDEVVIYHNMISIFVCVSIYESFGVAVIEASACEKPVVVSDAGGLPEVVENGVTGFVVPRKDPIATANAIEKLILNHELRVKMGRAGRKRVKNLYNWEDNVKQMIEIYTNQIKNREKGSGNNFKILQLG